MEWQSILAAGTVALISSAITTFFALHLDRRREKERFRSHMATLVLESFSTLNRLAETSAGLSKTLATAVVNERYRADAENLRTRVSDALHDAWYASRDLDVLLPDAREATERLRRNLLDRKEMAIAQYEAAAYDPEGFDRLDGVRTILDELTTTVRQAIGAQRISR